ncbi:MAG TPA: PQQ-binding-like beta-propeller repeat protein [Fimbriiglobus sp.]|jgi:outer membrane protein assembly factor BamB|nr:PQQ-binding-like beta-propeller repeat protein [Fimbriiglobus sp.]
MAKVPFVTPVFALALTLALTLPPALLAADWPNIHGPNRDNHSAETGLNWAWKDGPPVAWRLDVGAGFAGVAVSGGSVFLFHRVNAEEVLTALDPATGKEKWKFAARTRYVDDFGFDDGPRCVPVVSGGRVFALGANGDLHAVETATGKKLWHRNLLADYKAPKGYFGVGAGPIVIADRLLVNVGAKGAGIVAFDPATGKELWKATDDPPGYAAPAVIDLGGKLHAAFLTRGGLVVVEPVSGAVKFSKPWRSRLDASVNAAAPVVRKDELLLTVSYGAGAVLLKAKAGEWDEVWTNDRSLSSHYNTPVLVGDHLYGVHGRQEGGGAQLRCVEWKTGEVKWTVERFGVASLLAVDGGLLAVREGGELVRFEANPQAFKETARAKVLDGTVRAAPALSDGRLFLRDEKRLVCVKLK